MNLFRRRRELRQLYIDGQGFLRGLSSGDALTIEKACEIPAVASSLAWIIHRFAALPVRLLKEEEGGVTREIHGDYRTWLLNHGTPDDTMTGYASRVAFARDYLLRGEAYMHIGRKDGYGEVSGLRYVRREEVAAQTNAHPIWRTCRYIVGGETYWDFDFIAAHRNTRDGATGKSILAEYALPLTAAYLALEYERRMSTTGGTKKGFLVARHKLSETALEELKDAWRRLTSNETDGSNAMVLNDGVEYREAAMTAVEAQLNEIKEINARQIAEMFGLSSAILGGTATAEQIANAFRSAVEPICAVFLASANRNLLSEDEKREGKRFSFDTEAILGGDLLTRYRAYEIALKNHFMQPNEVRSREDLPPMEFDYVVLGLQDALYNPKTGMLYVPNTKETINLNQGGTHIES